MTVMDKNTLWRIGALSLVLGAFLVAVANLLAPQGGVREAVASAGYYPVALVNFVGGLVLMAAWPVVYLYQRKESGRAGFVGFAMVSLFGMALTVGFPAILLLIYPWLANLAITSHTLNTGPMIFNFFFAISSGLVSAGGVVFGVATIRAKVFSRQLGIGFIVLSVASAILGFLSLPGGGGIHMSWWWATTGTFGVLAYMIGMAWYGVELLLKLRGQPASE
ncbi:MAG TPA: hypothetical protein VF466_01420 [Candidatus Saccharimonadales bacterium]